MGPTAETESASDIRSDHWVVRHAPRAVRPYLRLARIDRPIGTWLLLIPCWWGVAFATASLPDLTWPDPLLFLWFAIGATVMRGAGCCWNDIMDRGFDAKVARTMQRPIANGDLTVRQALIFMGLLMLIGLAMLQAASGTTVTLFVNWLDDTQLAAMHETELSHGNYHYGRLDNIAVQLESGDMLASVHGYFSRRGHVTHDGDGVALASIVAENRTLPARDCGQMLAHVRNRVAPDHDLDCFILRLIEDNRFRKDVIDNLLRDAKPFGVSYKVVE